MPHAQIELYVEQLAELDDDTETSPRWGWRRVVEVEPRETLDDTGLVFDDRQAAYDDAAAKHPTWPIG